MEFRYLQSDHVAPLVLTTYENDKPMMYSYNSLAELNAEWEDVSEEPKTFWYITAWGDVYEYSQSQFAIKQKQAIGNYFETREEAELAVRKLKAWKRLKDKGFRFGINGECDNTITYGIAISFSDYYDNDETRADLDLLFGGEE